MAKSCCNKACIVQGEKYRFSVLTPFMMRMESVSYTHLIIVRSQRLTCMRKIWIQIS